MKVTKTQLKQRINELVKENLCLRDKMSDIKKDIDTKLDGRVVPS